MCQKCALEDIGGCSERNLMSKEAILWITKYKVSTASGWLRHVVLLLKLGTHMGLCMGLSVSCHDDRITICSGSQIPTAEVQQRE